MAKLTKKQKALAGKGDGVCVRVHAEGLSERQRCRQGGLPRVPSGI